VIGFAREKAPRYALAAVAGVAAVAIGALGVRHLLNRLPAPDAAQRTHSFIGPSAEVIVLVLTAALLLGAGRAHFAGRHRLRTRPEWATDFGLMAALALFGTQAVFLITAAPGVWSSSDAFFATNPAESQLESITGPGRVGFAECQTVAQMPDLGILPEANSEYGVSEVSAYDPIVPKSYFTSTLLKQSGTPPALSFGQFCPSVPTAAVARGLGVSYVLARAGNPAPPGMNYVARLGSEDLYAVPGSGIITLGSGRPSLDGEAPGTTIPFSDSNAASIRFHLDAKELSTLYIHISPLPGWTATLNGRPLPLHSSDGILLEASVRPGSWNVVLTYRPQAAVVGLAAATAAIALLAGQWAVPIVVRRRRGRSAQVTRLVEPSPGEN
jgi:hypothetical protein